MFRKKSSLIIGLVLVLMLILQTPTYAIYSRTIATKVTEIKEHIINSQSQHGTGTLTSMVETLIDADQLRREQGKSTGIPGAASTARKEIFEDMLDDIYKRPLDGLTSIFNYLASTGTQISNCLRDDIWTLEALKNQVAEEMIKAYMMVDLENGNILKEDYRYLAQTIDFLKRYGAGNPQKIIFHPETDEQMTVNAYLFGTDNDRNYYQFSYPTQNGCPEGDFEKAFQQIERSGKTLETLLLGRGSDWNWDSIIAAAEVRAKQRANQWAEANQISLTLAGENGAMQQGLIHGGGMQRLEGKLETEARIFEDIVVGPLTPLFSRAIWKDIGETLDYEEMNCAYYYPEDNYFRRCSEEELENKKICEEGTDEEKEDIRCDRLRSIRGVDSGLIQFKLLEAEQAQRDSNIESAELAFSYSVQLNSVAEANIESLDEVMSEINGEIKRGIEAVGGGAGSGLISVRNNMEIFLAKHCPNKTVSLPGQG